MPNHSTTEPNGLMSFLANAPRGLTSILVKEIRLLGGQEVKAGRHGVEFQGDIATGYRVCLWSRFASRVFLPLRQFPFSDQEELYTQVLRTPWEDHLDIDGSFSVSVTGRSREFNDNRFAVLRVKDAVADRFRASRGRRPDVHTDQPDVHIHCHIQSNAEGNKASLSLDLSGDGLHKRGYRKGGGAAPLKENLAAGILHLAGWRQVMAAGGPLMDPMCGSGTFLLEGALMAADIAPGLGREYYGFKGWKQHDHALWLGLLDEAESRREAGLKQHSPILGFDVKSEVIRMANENIESAGLLGHVHVETRELSGFAPTNNDMKGLVIVNPPYGKRVGDEPEMLALYSEFGRILRARFAGWKAAVFTSREDLMPQIGLEIRSKNELFNGPIETGLYHLKVSDAESGGEQQTATPSGDLPPPAPELANRLRKNMKTLGKWARRNKVSCYRLYDADLPEYAFAVDLYGDQVHVQEYAAPAKMDETKVTRRRADGLATIRQVLDIPRSHLHFKMRRRQKGKQQYQREQTTRRTYQVDESGLSFEVNLDDFLDTGLFLDHRITRSRVRDLSEGQRVLNLFAYTGSVSVYAAAGGAEEVVTVDMSRTYLDWAERNMRNNGFRGDRYSYDQGDVFDWLKTDRRRFEVIFLDPPTFSNSKRMSGTLDIQRDHVALIHLAKRHLTWDGVLVFSNNQRGFKLDVDALEDLEVSDITRQTIPEDFKRRANIHQCWELHFKEEAKYQTYEQEEPEEPEEPPPSPWGQRR